MNRILALRRVSLAQTV